MQTIKLTPLRPLEVPLEELEEQRLQERLNFIQVVLGPRQVGKTTGLQQIVASWQGPSLMVSADEFVQNAWKQGKELFVHGWIFSIENGTLKNLG